MTKLPQICRSTIQPGVNRRAGSPHRAARGLTLIEMIMTIVILAVLAALLLPQLGAEIPDQLQAGAEIVASDIEYVRSLAVVNNSRYRITFDPDASSYYFEHTGTNTLLEVLPASPFRNPDDPPDRQTTDLAALPIAQPAVRLVVVVADGATPSEVTDLEFNQLGATARTATTVLWMACGGADQERFIPISVNPVTGLVELGEIRTELPAAVASLVN